MAKFYVECGMIRKILNAATALDAVKKFIMLVISDDRVETGELSDGIAVTEFGFYKDLLSNKFGVLTEREMIKRAKKRRIIHDCNNFKSKKAEESVFFMKDDILKDVGYTI